ncbi:hypothetical protein [Streptomyces sp. SAI-127]|uniref:hypothetical protein n=1 Tax=Streptomyces sp. SAI-127 TaxID=2940543 RepID=UPI002475824C|nr:hypothetical protein [Streptomyces sp. SAI-127]MDH6489604.1 hypothetical protein [Streptomyces sp. SAI-127]
MTIPPPAECGPPCSEQHTYLLGTCALACTEATGGTADASWTVDCPEWKCQAPRNMPCRHQNGRVMAVSHDLRWRRYDREQATRPRPAAPATEAGADVLDASLAAQLGRPLLDRTNRHLAAGQRAEEYLARVRAIPRLPHVSQQTGVQGRAYTRGWESVIAMLDNALADCCVCRGGPVAYRNFKEQPFCSACSNCSCGQDVCVRTARPDNPTDTHPDMSADTADTRGGHVRTRDIGEQPPTCLLPVTSTDTVRTHPDTGTADTAEPGVRIEYRARVRRDQVHLAIADAFGVIARERGWDHPEADQ